MDENDQRQNSDYDDAPLDAEWGEPPLPFDERTGGTPLLEDDVERGFFIGGALTVALAIVWRAVGLLLPVGAQGWVRSSSEYFAPLWVGCMVALTLINLRSWKALVGLIMDARDTEREQLSTAAFALRAALLLLSKAVSLLVLVYILQGANGTVLVSVLVGFTLCLFFGSFCLLLR